MKLANIPTAAIDWPNVPHHVQAGETGTAAARTQNLGDMRLRLVTYSSGYLADHWCDKGHILLCLEGRLDTETADGRTFVLTPGVSYQVADHAEAHRSSTAVGAKLFIVD